MCYSKNIIFKYLTPLRGQIEYESNKHSGQFIYYLKGLEHPFSLSRDQQPLTGCTGIFNHDPTA